jgi:RimJ/RimL family protein N-acetyltransferase
MSPVLPPLPRDPLTDGTIVLRPATEADLPAVVAACQDPEIPRWTLVPSPYTEDDARAFLLVGAPVDAAAGRALHLLAFDARDASRLLGAVGLVGIDAERRVGEVGYWVAREARGQGVATRGTRLICALAARLGLAAVELLAHPGNAASIAVAERAGFELTVERRPTPRTQASGEPGSLVYVWRASSEA